MLFEKKKMPIGIDLFEKIRDDEWYYVDKTGFIADLIKNKGQVNLITRPRRFGKTLNMSMLKCFFKIGADPELFKGLAIEKETAICEKYMGKYPVIFISLKGADGDTPLEVMLNLHEILWDEINRFDFLEESDKLNAREIKKYQQLLDEDYSHGRDFDVEKAYSSNALKTLSQLLCKHYGKNVIILIDEYDVPLQKAHEKGFGKEITGVIRNMFQAALKTNDTLEFAVLTGCLRISKESLFTGLNNMKMFTLLNNMCDEWFGFTDAEVREMLDYYGCEKYYDLTRQWYDGYLVGGANVYNPWDVINWVDKLKGKGKDKTPMSFWLNTSGVGVVRKFIEKMDTANCGDEIEELISGDSVRKTINEQLTYEDLYDNLDNIWSLLFATGYLTPENEPEGNLVMLKIPNEEVRELFVNDVLGIFKETLPDYAEETLAFGEAIKSGEADKAQELLEKIENRRYIDDFKRDEMGKIIKYGIAFYWNKCKVVVGE